MQYQKGNPASRHIFHCQGIHKTKNAITPIKTIITIIQYIHFFYIIFLIFDFYATPYVLIILF